MLCGLFLSSYLLREFGDTDYGVYQTICSFANYLVLLEFGLGTVITRNVARCRAKGASAEEIQRNISTIWTIGVIFGCVICLFAFVFYVFIGSIYSRTLNSEQIAYAKRIFVFESVFLVVSFLSNIINGIFLGFDKYRMVPIINTTKVLLRTGLIVSIALLYRYAIIVAVIDACLSVVLLALGVFVSSKKLKIKLSIGVVDKTILKDVLPLCVAVLIQAIVNQANSNVDKFILGIKVSPESVAVYSIGLYVYGMFSSMTTIPISIYSPQVIKDVTSEAYGNRQLTERMVQPSRLIVLIGGSLLFGFVAVGKQFIGIVYGESYLVSWIIALIIMAPMLLNMSNGILINILDAKNKRMVRSLILLITTFANIVLTVFWIDWFGIIGASAATAVCTLLGQIALMDIYYSRKMGISVLYMYKEVFKGILVFQIIACGIGFLVAYLINNMFLSLIIGTLIYLAVFGVLFVLFGTNPFEKEMLNKFFHKSKVNHDN